VYLVLVSRFACVFTQKRARATGVWLRDRPTGGFNADSSNNRHIRGMCRRVE